MALDEPRTRASRPASDLAAVTAPSGRERPSSQAFSARTSGHKRYVAHMSGSDAGVSMGAVRRSLAILFVLIGSAVLASVPATAQTSPNPDVNVTCDPVTIAIKVYPGASRSAQTYCEMDNPTSYTEVVKIQVIADIAYAAPGALTINAGAQDEPFSVAVRGELRMVEGSRQLKILYSVESANGIANPNPVTKEVNMIILVEQFSLLRVEAALPFIQLRPKTDYIFEYRVFNDGNARDKFNLDITNQAQLEGKDFQVVLPQISTEVDSQQYAKVRVQVRTPKKQGWTDEFFTLTLQAESDFSSTEVNQQQSITIYVRGVFVPGFVALEPLAMVALAAAVLVGKRRFAQESDDEDAGATAPHALSIAPLP